MAETIGVGIDISGSFITGKGRVLRMHQDAAKALKKTFTSGDIENLVLASIKARFENAKDQRDPDTGKAWPKLHKTTVKRRKSSVAGKLKLVDTGSMKEAIKIKKKGLKKTSDSGTGVSEIGFPLAKRSGSSPQFTVISIAADHTFGFIHPNGRVLPPRPFMGVSKKVGKEIEKLFKLRLASELIEYI